MWTYSQATGKLSRNGTLAAIGYSGAEPNGKNNPAMQEVHDVGPIPQGHYTIDAPFDSTLHGPYALPLIPASANEMFGRSGFLCHGDSVEHPGAASEGCIIMPRPVRQAIWQSGDRELQVV
jgi:Protein of unknown function (DUF2778)